MRDKFIVEGSFSPGDFRFDKLKDAIKFKEQKIKEGYMVEEPRDLTKKIKRMLKL